MHEEVRHSSCCVRIHNYIGNSKYHHVQIFSFKGAVLVDEMKLSPKIRFDKNKFEFIGFTDLSKYTPENQRKEKGDHALVLLFQPYQGRWIQSIGAFLSKDAASGHVLTQIIMEATILLENAGFYVDSVTADGAQPNRGVWTALGVKPGKPYCTHFVDPTRKLYFFSDFPHLIKCMWHHLLAQKNIKVSNYEREWLCRLIVFINTLLYNFSDTRRNGQFEILGNRFNTR